MRQTIAVGGAIGVAMIWPNSLGIAVFTVIAALAAIVILRSVRETKGLRLSEIDAGGR
ncbi:hypothetical protein [Paraburkholderia sp. UCT31]|uniref:hypothetical protein n=1 Tax=Paraburkholderia sp. UCT31 TaxID=2615209 RepID=UPI0016552F70|nr:hypothetical protein [Paraburkholderia sp. UCT31]